jgi:glycosyltransferase involved in cell wall biosynthesis
LLKSKNIGIVDKKPLISLVVPVYMEEKILDQALDSYPKSLRDKYSVELIVSDGGSTDRTLEIADSKADKVARHLEDRRQTIAEGRNAGANLASGDVLVFINGDCRPENPELFLKTIYDWAVGANSKYSKSGALASRVYVPKDEEIFGDKIFYNSFNAYVRFLNIIGLGMCRGECQIAKTALFKKIGGYNSKLAAGEDFDLFNRLAKITKTTYVSEITVLESPRRFRKYGYAKVLWQWTKNGVKVLFKGEASDSEWETVR